jgi:small subunit ribosomal protein S8
MTMTDPIADMLTRIRNANTAMHQTVAMPASKLKVALAELLLKEGFIDGVNLAAAERGVGQTLTITLRYTNDRVRTITGLRRVSKPGLRVYRKSADVPRVLGGLGVAVVSTSKGLITDREARKSNLGGEILCYVW